VHNVRMSLIVIHFLTVSSKCLESSFSPLPSNECGLPKARFCYRWQYVLLNLSCSIESHLFRDPTQSKCVFMLPRDVLLLIFWPLPTFQNVYFVFTIFCKLKTVIWWLFWDWYCCGVYRNYWICL